MCLSLPGQVTSVEDGYALVRQGGRERRAATVLVPDLQPGDYVIMAGGLVITRLDEDEALARLSLFSDLDATPGYHPAT